MRGDGLRTRAGVSALCRRVEAWEGVVSVQGNPATGGVLLRYDPARIGAEAVEARLRQAFGAGEAPPAPVSAPAPAPAPAPTSPSLSPLTRRKVNQLTKVGLLVSMAATLLALQQGKKLHALFGGLHLAFLLVHLVHHRSRLLR